MPTNFASTAVLSNHIIPAYDRMVTFALRETPSFRSFVDRRPANVTNPGDTVYFTWYADLATTTTPLSETVSPDSIAIANPTRTSVTVNEYGTWVPKSLRLQKTSFLQPDMEIAELLARQQGDTIDALIKAKLDAGTNTLDGSSGYITAATIRTVRNKMRAKNVAFRDGANYLAHVHPDVTFDLMAESGQNVWSTPHEYVDTGAIYAGEVGRYSAVRFVENTRCKVTAPASGTAGTYLSYVLGQQALVEANVIEPHTVIGPQTDALNRLAPVGWYGFLGWSLFRPEALLVVKSQSSLAPALA
jgi:N4-gp56 family major capsid protein